MTDDADLQLVAIRELTAGEYGAIFRLGDQVQCPCEGGDQYIASLELEKGKGGAIIRYKDGSKLLLRAPFVALYQAPKPEPVQGLEPEAPEAAAEVPAEAPAELPEDRPPLGFLDDAPAPGAAGREITGPVGTG